MLGKLIATLVVLGILFLGAVWFFTGQTPSQFINKILETKNTDSLSTSNARDLVYSYKVDIDHGKKVYKFSVAVHVVKKTSNQICYTYKIASVKQGDPSFIRDYMYGYQSYNPENQIICTNLDAENIDLSMYFTKPDRTGKVSLSDNSGEAYVENGVLRSLKHDYIVRDHGRNIPVQLTVTLASTTSFTTPSSSTTTQPHPTMTKNNNAISSSNAKTLYYKFTWRINKLDIATGKPSNEYTTTSYEIRVDIVKRQGNQACIKYTVISGDTTTAKTLMPQLWPYSPGETKCIRLSASASQIPYFLFPDKITTTQSFSGEGVKGKATISHGILTHLEINGLVTIEDENGQQTNLPIKLAVDLVKASK